MPRRPLSALLSALLAAAALAASTAGPDAEREKKLSKLQDEMKRLRAEIAALDARERTVLSDVARLDAEIALRRTEVTSIGLRRDQTKERLTSTEDRIASVTAEQARRTPALSARVRAIYKHGPAGLLGRFLSPVESGAALDGLRYAAYLSQRDARQLAEFRASAATLAEERQALGADKDRLDALATEAGTKEAELSASRAARASVLGRIRGDREQNQKALAELEEAARNLGRLVGSLGAEPAHGGFDIRKFRGMLDWPTEGAVSAKFGVVVHPKFKTEVPHPGLDIDAPEGRPFRTVFDGRIVYAAPLSGYGLTVVVDHANGVLSVYAHASVLLVSNGDEVVRGQQLGEVGDSGSLRGPYLYFELREDGRPVDPVSWLRRH